jgi:CDP-diacylglycerol pyrophosphatase
MTPILVCPKAAVMDARDRIANAAIALKRINPHSFLLMIAEPENYTTCIKAVDSPVSLHLSSASKGPQSTPT